MTRPHALPRASRRVPIVAAAVLACSYARPRESPPPREDPPAAATADPRVLHPSSPTSEAASRDAAVPPEPAPATAALYASPDPSGVVAPTPDPTLATLPVDVRMPSYEAASGQYRGDCKAFARGSACELAVDLDGDGKRERAIKLRDRAGGRAGIGIRWADGSVSVIGAGAPSRKLMTDVYEDGVELSWQEVELDLSVIERWSVVRATAGGFAFPRGKAGGPPRPRAGSPRKPAPVLRAPAAMGAGLWLDGGDAVEVLYWDGTHWRRLVVGF